MTEEDIQKEFLFALTLHERIRISQDSPIYVMKVLGGYIYEYYNDEGYVQSSVFAPE